jgi:hypothetical protein
MPFSKYNVDTEHIETMRVAFRKVCDALLLKCDYHDPMTEVIANKIVAFAKDGEHDVHRLVELVLNDLADDGLELKYALQRTENTFCLSAHLSYWTEAWAVSL